jgi:hypothetical protein
MSNPAVIKILQAKITPFTAFIWPIKPLFLLSGVLLLGLAACVPAVAPVKPASSDVRIAISADSGFYQRDLLLYASENLKQIGYTVITSTVMLNDYGLVYNDTSPANVENAMKLLKDNNAKYAAFIYGKVTAKDPPLLSGFAAYAEMQATVSVIDNQGKLLRRFTTSGADGASGSSGKEAAANAAALKVAMKNAAAMINQVINP